jgi:hypothetical protein
MGFSRRFPGSRVGDFRRAGIERRDAERSGTTRPFWAQQSIEERGHHGLQFPRLLGSSGVERFA